MMMNHHWWQHHETQREIKLAQQGVALAEGPYRGSSHHKYIVHQVQLDQCSYQGFTKRKKDQSAAAKVRVELES